MKLRARLMATALALVTAAGIGFGVAPSSASAEGATIQACKPADDALVYIYWTSSGSPDGRWERQCSGTYSLNSDGNILYSGGWSGYITFRSGYSRLFCPNAGILLYRERVTGITMSATLLAECR